MPAPENYNNNAWSNLAGPITFNATTLTVMNADRFPSICPFRIMVDQEIMLVTARSGTTFTIIKGYEDTEPVAHDFGALVVHILTKGSFYASVESNETANLRLSASPNVNSVSASGSVLYAMPYHGNKIDLYEPTQGVWQRTNIGTGISCAVPANSGSGGGFNSTNPNIYDAFIYNDSVDGVKLELNQWETSSSRQPNGFLSRKDGVFVKAVSPEKRYVGTVMTVPSGLGGPLMDSPRRRYIYNAQNRVPRPVKSYLSTFNQNPPVGLSLVGNSTDNRFEYVAGLPEGFLDVELNVPVTFEQANYGESTYTLGFGDTTTSLVREDTITNPVAPYYSIFPARCTFKDIPVPGYRFIQALQVRVGSEFNINSGGSGLSTLIDGSYLS